MPRLQRWVDSVEEWFGGAESSKPLIERCRDCQACLREYTAYAKERAATLRHENEVRGGGAATGGSSGGSDGGGVAADAGGGGRGRARGGARPVLLELLACAELPEGDPGRLSEAAAYACAFFLLCAAYEATAALIGATLLSLLHSPRALATVRGQHASDKAVHAAVSEALRYCSPIKATRREVRADLVLASGERLRRGDSISFVHAALNLDAETFSHPSRCATWRALQPRVHTLQPRAPTLQPYVPRYDVARAATELRLHAGFGLGAHRSPGWRLGLVGACEAVQACAY